MSRSAMSFQSFLPSFFIHVVNLSGLGICTRYFNGVQDMLWIEKQLVAERLKGNPSVTQKSIWNLCVPGIEDIDAPLLTRGPPSMTDTSSGD